MGLEKLN